MGPCLLAMNNVADTRFCVLIMTNSQGRGGREKYNGLEDMVDQGEEGRKYNGLEDMVNQGEEGRFIVLGIISLTTAVRAFASEGCLLGYLLVSTHQEPSSNPAISDDHLRTGNAVFHQ